jgi:hypothetical protein
VHYHCLPWLHIVAACRCCPPSLPAIAALSLLPVMVAIICQCQCQSQSIIS